MMMIVQDRADNFSRAFPKYSPLVVHNERLYGFWLIGRYYVGNQGFYGSYPPGYLARVRSLFPDCDKILHLFSGSIADLRMNEVTYDIKPDFAPMVRDDVKNLLKHFQLDQFDLILADPPYEERDFEKYGCKPFNKKLAVAECSQIVKEHGFWFGSMLSCPNFQRGTGSCMVALV